MKTYELLKPSSDLRVLITGGATGIGRTAMQAFLEIGAHVSVCDVSPGSISELKRTHPEAHVGVADVSNYGDVSDFVNEASKSLGGLDVLIANAGIAGPTAAVEEISEGDWEQTIKVNLGGQFNFIKKVVPIIKATSSSGSVISVSSVAGRLGYPYRTPYASSKWAISGLVKSLAAELGPGGIRVNGILPGLVEGHRMDGVIRARAKVLNIGEEAMRNEYLKKISLRRMVSEQDVAALMLYLSSAAAKNITGQIISVDGNVEYL